MVRKAGFAVFASASLLCGPACAAHAPNLAERARIVERSSERFVRAVLYKPRDDGMTGIEQTFVPLIVEETAAEGTPEKALAPRIVYFDVSQTQIGEERFDQVVYFWTYADPQSDAASACQPYRGVRITIDHDGYLLACESLSSDAGPRLIFVAESLEQEARAAFGESKPENRLAIEKEAGGGSVVVATIEPGPVPMGPYVYVAVPPERAITTILCRCSPSQVDEFTATQSYDLQPIEGIESKCPNLTKKLATGSLEAVRWPRIKP